MRLDHFLLMSKLHLLWQRYLAVGVREDTPPDERNKIYITRGSCLFLVFFGPIFFGVNLAQGYSQLAFVNLTSTALGLICLFLVRRKIIRAASVLLIVGSGTIFFFSGLIFHNGMEYTLLLGMLGAVFLFESLAMRLLLAVVNGAGFLLVKILHFGPHVSEQFPLPRYAINLLIFLLGYCLILEIFRSVNRNYQRAIEQKNSDLAQSRRQLDEEQAELMARTSELQVANQTKERLFSIVAHDLRGPIGNLKSSLELLSSHDLTQKDFQGMVADLKIGVDVAYECLDTLLLWAARQLREIKPIFTEVSLEPAARDGVALLADIATHKNIVVHNTIPAEARVWADETQVSSIFRNLISNALKFTPGGGSIKISANKEDGLWCVTVSDTGIGMTQEQIRHLFESNNVTSTAGTENERGFGLGLQICHEFIKNNRGLLTVESQKDHGSSFRFKLPSSPNN